MFMFGMPPTTKQVCAQSHIMLLERGLAEFVDVLLGGIYAYNTKSIEVLSSSFINCNGSRAGAIYIYSAGLFTSNNTRSVVA